MVIEEGSEASRPVAWHAKFSSCNCDTPQGTALMSQGEAVLDDWRGSSTRSPLSGTDQASSPLCRDGCSVVSVNERGPGEEGARIDSAGWARTFVFVTARMF